MTHEDVAPVASGVNVGSGSSKQVRSGGTMMQPRAVKLDALDARDLTIADLLGQAEDEALALGDREAKRASLYEQPEADLKAKWGLDR